MDFINNNKTDFKNVFELTDQDNDGYINMKEFFELLDMLGIYYDKNELEELHPEELYNNINYDMFMTLLMSIVKKNEPDIRKAFRHFDKENTGKIAISEFINILQKHENKFSNDEIDELMKELYNDDGYIYYKN